MQEECESLMPKGTWELVALPKDCKSVGCKWIFCIRMHQAEWCARKQTSLQNSIHKLRVLTTMIYLLPLPSVPPFNASLQSR